MTSQTYTEHGLIRSCLCREESSNNSRYWLFGVISIAILLGIMFTQSHKKYSTINKIMLAEISSFQSQKIDEGNNEYYEYINNIKTEQAYMIRANASKMLISR